MQMLGSSAGEATEVLDQIARAGRLGLASLLWSDGADLTAIVAEDGDKPTDVRRIARRFLPEVLS